MTIEREFLSALKESIVLPVTCSIEQWAKEKENVFLSNPPYNPSGQFSLDYSPYLRAPLRALQDDSPAREIVFIKSPRLGGTLLAEVFLLWVLKTRPCDIWWAIHKADDIPVMQQTRLFPFLQNNGVKWDLVDDGKKIKNLIKFKVGSLKCIGAFNNQSMKMSSGKVLVGDEVSAWVEGVLEQYRRRADDYATSCKILLISEAGQEEKDLHKSFQRTNRNMYGFRCPHCDFAQEWKFTHNFDDGTFGALNWDKNDYTKPKGIWNIDRACETAHYTCTNPLCRKDYYDSEKGDLLKHGVYVETNPSASKEFAGFSVNALAGPKVTFKKLAREYLEADYDNKRGRHDPIKNFWTQRMSRFWSTGKQFTLSTAMVKDVDFNQSGSVSGSWERVMYVDTQQGKGSSGGFHPFVAVQFNEAVREIQMIDYGSCDTWTDVKAKQIELGIKNKRVLVDARGQLQDSTYQAVLQFRPRMTDATDSWIAAMGMGVSDRQMKWTRGIDVNTKNPIELPYSKLMTQPVRYGTGQQIAGAYVPLIKYRDAAIKDVFVLLRDNKHPVWKLIISTKARDDKDFIAQINNENKVMKLDKKGYAQWTYHKGSGANDYFDCLKGICLYGMCLGFL